MTINIASNKTFIVVFMPDGFIHYSLNHEDPVYPGNKGAGFDNVCFEIKLMVFICCRFDLICGGRLIFSSFEVGGDEH